jgi:tetratricopeptide (TPR) repeat protein
MPASARFRALEGHISPLERTLFADADDGRWDEHTLFRAALVASGVADMRSIETHEARFGRLIAELRQAIAPAATPRQKAEAAFEFTHQRVLRGGYRLESSGLPAALDEGRYNCVSASVLYNCLAEAVGLEARGLEVPGHAMSRIVLADGALDVETTCPSWFRLMDDPQRQARAVAATLGAAAASQAAERREVSAVELVATIYYNRGVDLLGERRFADAVAANAKALRLDPASETARGNLLATLNNWAIAVAAEGRHQEAAELLRRGLVVAPEYKTFYANYAHVHHQWMAELVSTGRRQEAEQLAQQAETDPFLPGHSSAAQMH